MDIKINYELRVTKYLLEYNRILDLSRVLIIYTGGTVGMKHTKSRGYIPVSQAIFSRDLRQ